MAKPKSKKLRSDRVIFVSLSPEQKTRLQDLAAADGRTVSQLVRRLIDRSLETYRAAA